MTSDTSGSREGPWCSRRAMVPDRQRCLLIEFMWGISALSATKEVGGTRASWTIDSDHIGAEI